MTPSHYTLMVLYNLFHCTQIGAIMLYYLKNTANINCRFTINFLNINMFVYLAIA